MSEKVDIKELFKFFQKEKPNLNIDVNIKLSEEAMELIEMSFVYEALRKPGLGSACFREHQDLEDMIKKKATKYVKEKEAKKS